MRPFVDRVLEAATEVSARNEHMEPPVAEIVAAIQARGERLGS